MTCEDTSLIWLLIMWSESHSASLWALPHHKSAPCLVWWPYVFLSKKYFISRLSRELTWPPGQRDMWRNRCVHLTISHQLAEFRCHRYWQIGYITLLIFHVTTHDHVVIWPTWIFRGIHLIKFTILPCLVFIGLAEEEIFCF